MLNTSNIQQDLELVNKIKIGELKISVYGLGHVGGPMAAVWLRAGAHVIGVDKSSKVSEAAKKGVALIPEPSLSKAYIDGIKSGRFVIQDDPVLASQDSYFKMICVPVLSNNRSADFSILQDVVSSIGKGLKKNDVISLNPSVPPGTTEDIVIPLLEKESGLDVKRDFCVIYNPERIYEGQAIKDIENNYPAVVSSMGRNSIKISVTLYSMIFKKGVFLINDIKTAETEKLLEGVYRDVNIALANEMAKFCEAVGVDFWEARKAANSQPFCHIHKAGIGVGGACIPIYPQFILDVAKKRKISCEITEKSRATNESMPLYCVKNALRLIKNLDLTKSIVTLLGLAFRGDVSDTRLSPTYEVIKILRKLAIKEIKVHDPYVKEDPNISSNVLLTPNILESINGSNLIILIADHSEYKTLDSNFFGSIPVYDGRGILNRSLTASSKISIIGVHDNE